MVHETVGDTAKIKGKIVDDSACADGRILVYRAIDDKLHYEDPPVGAGITRIETELTLMAEEVTYAP